MNDEGSGSSKDARDGCLGCLGIIVVVFLIVAAFVPSSLKSGMSAYEKGNFDKAVERLSRVEPGDAGYYEARNLLPRATRARDSTLIARAEVHAHNWEWDQVRSLLIPVLEGPSHAARAGEMLARADEASDYEDLWYAPGQVNVRDAPSERGSVSFQLGVLDAVRLSPPDSNGWAPVHKHFPSRDGSVMNSDGGASAAVTADTMGFVYTAVLSSDRPQAGGRASTSTTPPAAARSRSSSLSPRDLQGAWLSHNDILMYLAPGGAGMQSGAGGPLRFSIAWSFEPDRHLSNRGRLCVRVLEGNNAAICDSIRFERRGSNRVLHWGRSTWVSPD
ncbi:MAG: hypothetical protein WD942_12300 [Dehalococcoidia bacterium]